MGGYGSGRTGYKQKAEHCRSLDVNRLHRDGCLQAGKQGHWIWSRDGEEIARIGYKAERGRFVLDCKVRLNGGDWEPIKQPIPLTYTDCHYGNQRPYFRCPGVVNGRHCGRRVGKLFSGGCYFLCRHCYNVNYASQSETRMTGCCVAQTSYAWRWAANPAPRIGLHQSQGACGNGRISANG
ncbi:hypothetical protein [Ascidiaceihabitans sp.]|uniref:hypothetical protein n=1 Tax=Ascidiaceihabitans sp. TaxID=1872644 RepID=UPI003297746F